MAGPLDDIEHDGTVWYDEFDRTRPGDVVAFMPGRAYLGAGKPNAEVVSRANGAMLRASNGVVANLSGPGRALGTIREIEFAKSLGKHVIAVGDIDRSLASWDLVVVPDLASAVNRLARGR